MKSILLTLSALFITLCVSAQKPAKIGTTKYLEEKRGFKNIILGADISTIEQSISLSSDTSMGSMPGVKFYEVVDSDMKKVGETITLKKILIGSFNGKIAFLYMNLEKPNGSLLKKSFDEAYGGGYQNNRYIEKFIWHSKSVALSISYDRVVDDQVLMYDRILYDAIEKYGKEQSIKSVKDI